jgi:hypothetical protein
MARAKKSSTSDLISYDDEGEQPSFDLENFEEGAETEESFYADEPAVEEVEEKPKKTVTRRPKSTTTKGHYVTNSVLLPEVIRAKQLGRVTNELARMILMIAERFSCKSNFVGYSFREDMVSFAMVNLMANALKFNPEKSNNPFAFYTTAIRNSFLQYLADEKKHRDIRDSLIVEEGLNPSFNYSENGKDDQNFNSDNY